ncbi:hypothetical protein A2V49_01080 [candidate division WWE3 bacterium RBG_19FT_COMBO_34_6]|uniref:Magnesium transporter CorA n=1 Tax=candidate division WWE3 bacterium RBG_19FT_COMBO_34_6 TaxID=1802612 RepID=A0A1F4UL70_UNCKA|nr:MAG: hypothetical protein A2V49_01080 [candidate division WWE3 bacterium RBG_19FT_COMBO_34_6]
MIDYYFKNKKFKKPDKLSKNKIGTWIRITDANSKDLSELSRVLGIDQEDMEDCLDEFEIPRIEKLDNGILLILKIPKISSSANYTETFSIIVTDKNVVTVSLSKDKFLDYSRHLKNDLNTDQKYMIVFTLLMRITEEFTYEIKKIRHQVLSNLAQPNYSNLSESRIINLTYNDEILSQFLAVLIPMKLVLTSLRSGSFFRVFEKDSDLLEDIILNINQSAEIASTNMKSIRSLRDSYQILFTNKLNKEIRLLTYLTILLTIPMLIASYFGMNVPLPFQSNSKAHLIIIILSVSFVSLVLYLLRYFMKRK